MSHFVKKCEFGKSHGTCRCPSKNKTVIEVPCDRPGQHAQVEPVNPPWSKIVDDFLRDDAPREPKAVDIRFTPEEAKALRSVLQGDTLAMSWDDRVMLVHAIGVQLRRIGEEDA